MLYAIFNKKQDYYNIKSMITQSFKESIEYRVLRIELRKRTREKKEGGETKGK
jgi:hypothetical protein